jgi:hypothetical protein
MQQIRKKRFLFNAFQTAMAMSFFTSGQSVQAQACDRQCLEEFVDNYLEAVIANDPSLVPIASNTKFTEDGVRLTIGDGLWNTMKGKGKYRLFVTDVEAQQVAFIGTIFEDHRDPEQQTPALLALRLRIRDNSITAIEQIVVRDANAAAAVDAMGSPHDLYTQTVPAGQRMTRQALFEQSNKYFSGMQQNDGKGDYPFAEDCNRLENGHQTTNLPTPEGETRPDPLTSISYSAQWSCSEQFDSGLLHFVNRIRDRRFVALDTERGLSFAFGFFDHSGGSTRTFQVPDGRTVTSGPVQPWTWQIAEIFKVEDGLIRKIEAILQRVPYGMNSGWSTWEMGMSDLGRDVTKE